MCVDPEPFVYDSLKMFFQAEVETIASVSISPPRCRGAAFG